MCVNGFPRPDAILNLNTPRSFRFLQHDKVVDAFPRLDVSTLDQHCAHLASAAVQVARYSPNPVIKKYTAVVGVAAGSSSGSGRVRDLLHSCSAVLHHQEGEQFTLIGAFVYSLRRRRSL
ncbi:hypothetical protein pipiens_006253 [Culex pipiens pipiens]|uniref:Uncharacterized protein n=1 Tax=Culex pipiens pipiens TaxID=38569 RepID=A0ABD1DQK0_CULPP